MILIALGANLPSSYGSPAQTIEAAKRAIEGRGISLVKAARIWLTAPVPYDPDQDWYHNSVVAVDTDLPPQDLLQTLLDIELEFGRVRTVKNAPRLLDLDIVAYNDYLIEEGDNLIVPHPRMHERLFVLKPLEDIDKNWIHPRTKQRLADMITACPEDQEAKPMDEEAYDD